MEAADKNFNKKGRQQAIYLGFLVPPARFERATCGLEELNMSYFFTLAKIFLNSFLQFSDYGIHIFKLVK